MRAGSAAAILWISAIAGPSAQAPGTAATVVASATFSPRTSLVVSAEVLRFDVLPGAGEATAVVEFTAGARTFPGTDVVMTVEPVRGIAGPGGAADIETVLSFDGDGEGTRAGAMNTSVPSVVGQWSGGGLRQGRIVFTLRAAAPGTYTLRVRFLLSLP